MEKEMRMEFTQGEWWVITQIFMILQRNEQALYTLPIAESIAVAVRNGEIDIEMRGDRVKEVVSVLAKHQTKDELTLRLSDDTVVD